jgi:ketosteroid isomerase-like protein
MRDTLPEEVLFDTRLRSERLSRQNVEIIRRLFDGFNRRDASAMADLRTADGEWSPAYIGGGLLEGAVFRGHEGLAEFVELQSETWERVVAEPVEIQHLGDKVLVEGAPLGRRSGKRHPG